jgi:1-aminocyclopropane-1-carboxylate deaminase/D-cysteine desulfhydrase-like pyridoxal-dependent ACC family enzyme
MDTNRPNIPVDIIANSLTESCGVQLQLLRLDTLHPVVSGNKWFKLHYNLETALQQGHHTLLTFGGAFSNHLVATAAACREAGLQSIGIVRGDATTPLSPTLQDCLDLGMTLHWVDRSTYRQKAAPDFLAGLEAQYGPFYLVPEGGDNEAGVKGAASIMELVPADTTDICCAMGTGTTLAGLLSTSAPTQHIHGFPAIKQGDYLAGEVNQYTEGSNFTLHTGYHFGGFGKHTPELLAFMNDFYQSFNIPLDFVYTAKMMYGIFDMLAQRAFEPGAIITAIHSGGLQGNRSLSGKLDWIQQCF